MKQYTILFLLLILVRTPVQAQGDKEALKPSITREQKWQNFEHDRLQHKTPYERLKEFFAESIMSLKHSFLFDILFFKNNKIKTPFAQEVVRKFGRSLSDVTILDKPMSGPACTIFNTIILDHKQMSKLTKEEQAFILGHELVHLKHKDWIMRPLIHMGISIASFFSFWSVFKICNHPESLEAAASIQPLLQCTVLLYAYSMLSRFTEKRCDIEAAKTLNMPLQGASVFYALQEDSIKKYHEVPLNPHGILYNIKKAFGIFDTHPELHERRAYLSDLAESQADHATS